MNRHRIGLGAGVAAWLAVMTGIPGALTAQEPAGPPPPQPGQELPEVLARGPIHEAFAEPVDLQNQEPLTAPSAPPEPIAEAAPAEQPTGDNYSWVPGYWAWDPDRGYIWISACWRAAPPGMYWVPGYWVQDGSQWQWVSGFWATAGEREIEYLPPPPTLPNVEPTGPSPDNSIWVSPCWYWYSGQYVLRSGYWLNANPDWSWEPSHYVWTPRGHVFVPGHWDYAFERRGVLFAPVYFPPSYYYGSSRYVYTPSVVLDLGILLLNLFAYPRYSHYCFGDYYDDGYLQIGIYPWYDSVSRFSWYDPVYLHQRWNHHRNDPRWDDRVRDDYRRRYHDRDARPARTVREQDERWSRRSESERGYDNRLARRLAEVAATQSQQSRWKPSSADVRQQIDRQGSEMRQFQRERVRWEASGASRASSGAGKPDSVTVPEERRTGVKPQPDVRQPSSTGDAGPRERDRTRDGGGASVTQPAGGGTPSDSAGKPVRTPESGVIRDNRAPSTVRPVITPVQPEPARPAPRRPEQPLIKPDATPSETPSARQPQPVIKPREDRTPDAPVVRMPESQPPVRQPQPVIKPRDSDGTPTAVRSRGTEAPEQPAPRERVQPQPVPQPSSQPAPQPRVRITKPERVSIPAPPAVTPSSPAQPRVAPPAPAGEFKQRRDSIDGKDGKGVPLDEDGKPIDGRSSDGRSNR